MLDAAECTSLMAKFVGMQLQHDGREAEAFEVYEIGSLVKLLQYDTPVASNRTNRTNRTPPHAYDTPPASNWIPPHHVAPPPPQHVAQKGDKMRKDVEEETRIHILKKSSSTHYLAPRIDFGGLHSVP